MVRNSLLSARHSEVTGRMESGWLGNVLVEDLEGGVIWGQVCALQHNLETSLVWTEGIFCDNVDQQL